MGGAHDVGRGQSVEPHGVAVGCRLVAMAGHGARFPRAGLAKGEDGGGAAGEDMLQERPERRLVDGGVGVGLVEDSVEDEATGGGGG